MYFASITIIHFYGDGIKAKNLLPPPLIVVYGFVTIYAGVFTTQLLITHQEYLNLPTFKSKQIKIHKESVIETAYSFNHSWVIYTFDLVIKFSG